MPGRSRGRSGSAALPSRARWGLTLALPVIAALFNVAAAPLTENVAPFLGFFPALTIVALVAGRGPGYIALSWSTALCALMWDSASGPLPEVLALAGFLAAGTVIVEVVHRTSDLDGEERELLASQRAEQAQRRTTEAALHASETRLELALQAAELGAWELDPMRDTVTASDRVRQVFGAAVDEAPRDFWLSRLHPEDRGRVEAELAAAIRGEAKYDTEFRVVVEGEVRWVRSTAVLVGVPEAPRLVGLAEDATARIRAMEEMKRGREELQTMLDIMPVGVAVAHDTRAENITASPMLAELLRLAPSQNASYSGPDRGRLPYRCLRDGVEIAADDLPMQVASRTGLPVRDFELDLVFDDGQTRTLIVSAAPLFDAQGEVRGAIGTHVDVTALKQAQRALEAADRQKDEFLATLAHELRNPMAPIRYAAALLRPDATPEVIERARVTIERQSAQMARLLDDLLDVSRITRNVIELRREVLDLREVVREALDTAGPAIEARGLRLVVSLPPSPLWVDGDATRLLQVMGNLLNNATKYTEPGGRIEVEARAHGELASIRIEDTGIGLAPEMLPKVFELFSRVHTAVGTSVGGLGIGLAVVRRLVRLHGGEVSVHSDGLGRGARFVVELKLAQAPRRAPPRDALVSVPDARPRVLIAEDNVESAETLAALLGSHGLEVRVAHDGSAALAMAEELRPSVLVLDIGLPGMNGYEVARAVRERGWGKTVRIIAVTGWGQARDRRGTLEAGFDAHLVKPVDPEVLLSAIQESGTGIAAEGLGAR